MNHEPTDKQKWAVELILSNNPTLDKPDFSFETYRDFISVHSEEYRRYKQEYDSGVWESLADCFSDDINGFDFYE